MIVSVGKAPRPDFVPMSSELVRVSKIPRRTMAPADLEWLADEMTKRLKTPRGTMRLKPVQAWALFELGTVGGLFAPITVGGGKTLISLLAPVVMKAQRPLLIVPAGLVEKTKRDKEVLEQHWHLPLFIRIMSYEWLGRVQAGGDPDKGKPGAIDEWDPDLIILDECHRAKNNRGAAVARRITRFFRDRHGKRRVVVAGHFANNELRAVHAAALSGTVTKRSIYDYAHILTWCLPRELVPIPTHPSDLAHWSEALDEKKGDFAPLDPGALETLCADKEDRKIWDAGDRTTAARKTFRRRLIETPGVVATYETQIDASIVVRGLRCDVGPNVDAAFEHLRKFWETPDGWSIADPLAMARHAKELALGFFYVWDPRPPELWYLARKTWHQLVRQKLKHSRKYDSEKQVRQHFGALAQELLPKDAHPWLKEVLATRKARVITQEQVDALAKQFLVLLEKPIKKVDKDDLESVVALIIWKAVEYTFEPNTVPVWIDDEACKFTAAWAEKNTGIVWVEHKCVGERLRDEFGLSYYGRKGFDINGKFIDDHDRRKSLVASRHANHEGRNLQGWCKNLITSLLPNGSRNEQLIGRTHRPGQLADEVEVEFLVSCREHLESLDQAMNDARYIEHSTGSPQKLLLATVDVNELELRGFGPRWVDDKD
jgi:hypothetical protein